MFFSDGTSKIADPWDHDVIVYKGGSTVKNNSNCEVYYNIWGPSIIPGLPGNPTSFTWFNCTLSQDNKTLKFYSMLKLSTGYTKVNCVATKHIGPIEYTGRCGN